MMVDRLRGICTRKERHFDLRRRKNRTIEDQFIVELMLGLRETQRTNSLFRESG